MYVDVRCRKCGQSRRLKVGDAPAGSVAELIRLVDDRLRHRPSFECFGGHLELRPPVPEFWEVDWASLGAEE